MAESDKPDNAYDGLKPDGFEDWQQKDPRSIGPNGKRPMETTETSFVLGQPT